MFISARKASSPYGSIASWFEFTARASPFRGDGDDTRTLREAEVIHGDQEGQTEATGRLGSVHVPLSSILNSSGQLKTASDLTPTNETEDKVIELSASQSIESIMSEDSIEYQHNPFYLQTPNYGTEISLVDMAPYASASPNASACLEDVYAEMGVKEPEDEVESVGPMTPRVLSTSEPRFNVVIPSFNSVESLYSSYSEPESIDALYLEETCNPPTPLPETPRFLISLPSGDVLWQANMSLNDEDEIIMNATPRIEASTRRRVVSAVAESGLHYFQIYDSTGVNVVEEYWNVGVAH